LPHTVKRHKQEIPNNINTFVLIRSLKGKKEIGCHSQSANRKNYQPKILYLAIISLKENEGKIKTSPDIRIDERICC
jgi:hypothetical protein